MSSVFLRITLRNIKKNVLPSFIKVIGFSITSSIFYLLTLLIYQEYTFDNLVYQNRNTYYLENEMPFGPNKGIRSAFLPSPISTTIINNLPEVKNISRFKPTRMIFESQKGDFNELGAMVDSAFFQIFSFNILEGNHKTILDEGNSVIISEKLATKIFEGREALGEYLSSNGEIFEVSGIFENIPFSSSVQGDFFVNFKSPQKTNWQMNNVMIFLNTDEHLDREILANKMDETMINATNYLMEEVQSYFPDYKGRGIFDLSIIPLSKLHFSESNSYIGNRVKDSFISTLIIVASLLFALSVFNYLLLNYAGFSTRIKEIGVRKTLGSSKFELLKQFFFESLFLTSFSILIAILIAVYFKPYFETIIDRSVYFTPSLILPFLTFSILLCLFISFFAGALPILTLISKSPLKLLNNNLFKNQSSKSWVHIFINFLQFGVCIVFIGCTLIIHDQINFIKNKNIGFEKDRIIKVSLLGVENLNKIKNRIEEGLKNRGEYLVSSINNFPFYDQEIFNLNDGQSIQVNTFQVSHEWITTLGITLKAGRNFNNQNEVNSVILNEKLWNDIGRPALGENLKEESLRIIGIVKDFNYESLNVPVKPTYFHLGNINNELLIKFSKNKGTVAALNDIKVEWSRISENSLNFVFLDDYYERLYNNTYRWQAIINFSTSVGIILSCLGLFAYSSFTIRQKLNEVAIRKVLGAGSSSLLWTLNKRILLILVVSFLTMLPILIYLKNEWFKTFAYHVELSLITYLLPLLSCLIIYLITTSYYTISAIKISPQTYLRNDH